MNKILTAIFAFGLLAACSKAPEGFVGKEYKLTNAPDKAEITIAFDKNEPRFYGQSAVNRYFGSYKLENGKLTLGPIGSTMMAGPQDMMKAESSYLQFLPEVVSYKLEAGKLTLTSSKGGELVFEELGPISEDAAE